MRFPPDDDQDAWHAANADLTARAVCEIRRLPSLAQKLQSISSDGGRQITLRVGERCVLRAEMETADAGRVHLTTLPDGCEHGSFAFASLGQLCGLLNANL